MFATSLSRIIIIVRAFAEVPKYRGHNAVSDARTIVDGLRLL